MLKVGESLLRSAFVTGKSTVGGNVCFVSGSGRAGASGESGRILVLTQNAGIKGTSGAHFLATGTASLGDSGAICLGSGVAKSGGGGSFVASVWETVETEGTRQYMQEAHLVVPTKEA